VVLAVVGPRWLEAKDEQGRLDDPDDWVRVELETAQSLGKRVIPVLAGGAPVLSANELPTGLRWFADYNALRVTTERFQSDIAGLVEQVRRALAEEEAERSRREEEQRRAVAMRRAEAER